MSSFPKYCRVTLYKCDIFSSNCSFQILKFSKRDDGLSHDKMGEYTLRFPYCLAGLGKRNDRMRRGTSNLQFYIKNI